MLAAIVQFVACAVVIVGAGSVLTHCADVIAEKTGLGRLVVGSVLLGGTTSLPELTVDISAVRLEHQDLAVGDLIGSSLMNLLILAVLDLSHRSRGRMLSREAAGHALSGMVSVSLTALVGLGIFLGPKIANWNFLEINVVVWILILGYGMGLRLVYLDQRISARAAADQGIPLVPEHAGSLKKSAVGFVIAATVILFAGPRLASAAATLADLSGLGNSFVGTTFVAISTSLPELVSSLAALRLGAIDLAIGNVFGSNAFNMMLFAPLDIVCKGSLLANVSTTHLITCLTVIICSQVTLMGQLYQGKERSRVLDPNAYLVIALIFASLGMVYAWAT